MADYGTLIYNKGSSVVIDSLYKNYSYQAHGTSNLLATPTEVIQGITPNTNNVAVAWRPTTSGYSVMNGLRLTGGVVDGIRFYSEVNQTINYIYFTEGLKDPIPDYGLVVYGEDGTSIIFSSGETSYFKILKSQIWNANIAVYGSCPSPSPPPNYVDITVNDADNNYFFVMGRQYGFVSCGSTGVKHNFITGLKKINSTTIRIGFFEIWSQVYTGGGIFTGAASAHPQLFTEVEKPSSI